MSSLADNITDQQKGPSGSSNLNQRDREDKLKIARERQNEDRQRKIDELKAQAEAAQRYREQKEEERRRRIDDIRSRESEKRHQVEERKKAIIEAEKERRDYILRKNMERESRLETKKRERNITAFAFGSSTPRLLDTDIGMVSPSTFWAHRRSTSISNVALSRRSSERELTDIGSKKRATSACGAGRNDDDGMDSSHMIFRSVARRKTDLMPTMPSPREGLYGSRYSLSSTPRTTGRAYSLNRLDQLAQPIRRNGEHIRALLAREKNDDELNGQHNYIHTTCSRSGNVTPGGNLLTSRPGSSLSSSTNNTSVGVPRRSTSVRKPRPASIAGTGVSTEDLNKYKMDTKLSSPNKKRQTSLMSTSMTMTSSFSRPSSSFDKRTPKKENKNTVPKSITKSESIERVNKSKNEVIKGMSKSTIGAANNYQNEAILKSNGISDIQNTVSVNSYAPNYNDGILPSTDLEVISDNKVSNVITEEISDQRGNSPSEIMSASMIAKNKITTEEEAKAALAERRKAAREEAERQAEFERQRIEAERLEIMRKEKEEMERQRQFELEALHLAEEQRRAEEKRLQEAIEQTKLKEEDERRKREEEEKLRLERKESEKRAKEETEKQILEVAERLKREEKEREERRKRVEAIMARTRKAGTGGTPVKDKELNDEKKELSEQEKTNDSSEHILEKPHKLLLNTDESQNSQAMYEQSVSDKEFALINNFSNMIIEENEKTIFAKQELSAVNGNNLNQAPSDNTDIQEATSLGSIHLINNLDVIGDQHFNNNNGIMTNNLVSNDGSSEIRDISLL